MAAKLASEVMFVETKSSGVQPLQRMCHSIFKRQWEQIVVLRTAAKKISKDLGNQLERPCCPLYPEHPPFLYYFHFPLQPQVLMAHVVFSYYFRKHTQIDPFVLIHDYTIFIVYQYKSICFPNGYMSSLVKPVSLVHHSIPE